MAEVIRVAESVTGRRINVDQELRRSGDPARLLANADKAKRELNWNPQRTDFRDLLNDAWNWEQLQYACQPGKN